MTKDEDEKGRESREEFVREPATRTASCIHASGWWCVLDPSSSVEKWSRHPQFSWDRGYKSRAYYHSSQGEYTYGIRLLLLSANSLQPRLQLLLLYSVPFLLGRLLFLSSSSSSVHSLFFLFFLLVWSSICFENEEGGCFCGVVFPAPLPAKSIPWCCG